MNTQFTAYIAARMTSKEGTWHKLIEQYANKHVLDVPSITTFTRDNDLITYTGKSDSVQLVHVCLVDLWYIEIFPVDSIKEIDVIRFSNEDDAIAAFTVWATYMDTVVYMQFKNF